MAPPVVFRSPVGYFSHTGTLFESAHLPACVRPIVHPPRGISMSPVDEAGSAELQAAGKGARQKLDAHAYETVQWHFHPSTGCPFWLDYASKLKFDPLKEVKTFDDLKKFPLFEDEWLRGGPVR